ncbi:MAG: hypothetical protein GEU99_07585 [Luteitalea sp.]|nr:hypothetical protein [Luteitalea sp.]
MLLLLAGAACTSTYEIPVETPIQPKLDVSPFQRVFVAGFVAAGSEDVDSNLETVRLLRSQLRTKSDLRVIDADVLPLAERGREQAPAPTRIELRPIDRDGQTPGPSGTSPTSSEPAGNGGSLVDEYQDQSGVVIRDEKQLATYEPIFADVNFWKKIGEEFQEPLIVTGTLYFVPYARAGPVVQEREAFDQLGRRVVRPVRVYMERKGYILRPKFVFIDGRTGTVIYTEAHREERLYMPQQNVPALSSYFEMMDAILPSFLNALSEQRIRGVRILLR